MRKGSRVRHAERRRSCVERLVQHFLRGGTARRLVLNEPHAEARKTLRRVDVRHRPVAERERQHRRPAFVLEYGVEESGPSTQPVDHRFAWRCAERRGDAQEPEDVVNRAGARLLTAEGVVAGEDSGKRFRRLGVADGPGEEVRASRRVALAGFRHALANERLEIALSGHDRSFRSHQCLHARPHVGTGRKGRSNERDPEGTSPPLLPLNDPGRWAGGSSAADRPPPKL